MGAQGGFLFIVHPHSLLAGVSLALVFFSLLFLLPRGSGDDAHHALLQTLFFKKQTVLVPDEVGGFAVVVVPLHAPFEQPNDVLVVGVGRETQTAAVVHEFLEFGGLVQAQFVNGHFLLLAFNVIIFLVLGAAGQSLPGKGSAQKVKQHVTDSFEIVTAGLLVSNVSVDRSVTRGSGQVLSFSEGNVLSLGVLVALGETEINDVDVVLSALAAADKEVIRLDISVNDSFLVNLLNALNHLDSDVQNCPQVKLASALLEKIFQTLTEEVHDHNVIHLSVFGLLIADEVEVGHESALASTFFQWVQ